MPSKLFSKTSQSTLHGHEPLTRTFTSAKMLAQLKPDLVWLHDQVIDAIRRGETRAAIHEANLIPPNFLGAQPEVYQPYLILREHVIDRLHDQNVGYWQPDLQGMEHLGSQDSAGLLVDYLGLSERQLVRVLQRLVADGRYELAASLLESTESRFARSTAIADVKRLVYLKLMEKNQNTDPFKFIIYSAKIGEQMPQMTNGAHGLAPEIASAHTARSVESKKASNAR
jgi:alkyl sulfatase BDS1-like metallo-beta-lactamase superfamily hydrolase